MRKVVGARRSDIIKQFLGESVLLSLISFCLAVILVANLIAVPAAYFAARMFLNLFVSRTKLDAGGIVATVAFTFVVALITISYQVIKTARAVPVDSLRYE
jgi:putative ABC transport system permease protein